jgi:putative flippase GtrA
MQKLGKIGRFLVAGGLNTGFGFAVYALFVYLRFPVWATVTLSMIAALIFNYLTYGGMVFRDLSWRNLPMFVVFYVALAGLNTALLHGLNGLGFGPLLAQAILVPPLAVLSYVGLSNFVFHKSQTS